jgi:serine/threonine protein kinase/tetratricopeptide (TPR) repeat protein
VDSSRAARLKEILQAVAALSEPERSVFLDEACKDDPDLRREVESVLAHESDPTTPGWTTGAASSGLDSHPTEIGPYRILERIGEGGMGVVYLAEQTEPVRRRVALKVIKLGMDTKQVVARFEAERQALAMMDHPNIARVLDAGATPDGRPYFVMECVQGIPITDYCDLHNLKMPERLELFTQICEAVQHAHQKGVIHRDLKPSNVLVEVMDDHPVPKVIDFGVAKATAHQLTERTVYTEQGQLIGTPEYMSPEQAEMTGLNVDTRTDIYSLGVLLYQLLVGALPFERETLRTAGYAGIHRILREVDPPRPSTRLSSLGADTETVAKRRQTDRSSLLSELRGDLDWITMKALEKDRTRRYASASEFAADIERFLNDEPVLARPPAATYRMRKYVKRHRVGVGFAATIGLGLVLAFVLTAVQNRRISAARDESDLVTATLEEMLESTMPSESGRDVTVKEVLDEMAKTLGERFEQQPLVEARLRLTVGNTYYALGGYDAAEGHEARALEIRRELLGEDDPLTLEAKNNLGWTYIKQGRYEESEALFRMVLEERVVGQEDATTVRSMHGLAWTHVELRDSARAESLAVEALEISRRVLGEEHRTTLGIVGSVAGIYERQGRSDEAEVLQRETLEIQRRTLGDEDPMTLTAMGNLAVYHWRKGRYDEAEGLQSEVLEVQRRTLGEEHPNTLLTLGNLAYTYSRQGRHKEAETLHAERLEICRRARGDDSQMTLDAMHNLAKYVYLDQGRYDEAEALFGEALEISRRVNGEADARTLHYMADLSTVYIGQGRHDEAAAIEQECVDLARRGYGDDDPETNSQRYNSACGAALRGDRDGAIGMLREALDHGYRGPSSWPSMDDPDLASLHGDPEFEAIAEELRRRREDTESATVE